MTWGLVQIHCVMVPLIVMFFPMSYAASPWCASSGSERIETPTPRARTIRNLPFRSHLLFGGTGPAFFGTGPTFLVRVRPHLSDLDAILKTALATVKCASNFTVTHFGFRSGLSLR